MNYELTELDIKQGEAFVDDIKNNVDARYQSRVYSKRDNFYSLYEITQEKLIAAATRGVSEKLKIAQQLNQHNTIGIDLVAICVNDILCCGSTPLFFMDHLGSGTLDRSIADPIISGIKAGCELAQIPFMGGGTAALAGIYEKGEYDLAGFAIGEVLKKDLIDGSQCNEGDKIIALTASGLHTNGFSLIRRLVGQYEDSLLNAFLTPTKIYAPLLMALLKTDRSLIKGMAQISTGGINDISRINPKFDYCLGDLPDPDLISPLYRVIQERSHLNRLEMYQTFNMGIGLVMITDHPKKLLAAIAEQGETAYCIGQIQKGHAKVLL